MERPKKEIKPCPFCGRKKCVRIRVYPSRDLNDIEFDAVVCDHMHGGCGSESGHYKRPEDAVKNWNRRINE